MLFRKVVVLPNSNISSSACRFLSGVRPHALCKRCTLNAHLQNMLFCIALRRPRLYSCICTCSSHVHVVFVHVFCNLALSCCLTRLLDGLFFLFLLLFLTLFFAAYDKCERSGKTRGQRRPQLSAPLSTYDGVLVTTVRSGVTQKQSRQSHDAEWSTLQTWNVLQHICTFPPGSCRCPCVAFRAKLLLPFQRQLLCSWRHGACVTLYS